MGKTIKGSLRPENGKREAADALHIRFNKLLHCPNCNFHGPFTGAFNKDSGGTPDVQGRGYRRFRCRSKPRCGKSLGVTEFLELCSKISTPVLLDNKQRVSATSMNFIKIDLFQSL